MPEEVKGHFRFEKDVKRFHRFKVETDEGVVGTIYVPKDIGNMPKKLILSYLGKDD